GNDPPAGPAPFDRAVLWSLDDPCGERGQQERRERIRRVVLQLEAIVRHPLPDGRHENEERRWKRMQPPHGDPEGGHHRGGACYQREEAEAQFRSAEHQERGALHDEPPEGRALPEPQRPGQPRERAIADIDRDHLFVEPERRCSEPLRDVGAKRHERDQNNGDNGNRTHGSDRTTASAKRACAADELGRARLRYSVSSTGPPPARTTSSCLTRSTLNFSAFFFIRPSTSSKSNSVDFEKRIGLMRAATNGRRYGLVKPRFFNLSTMAPTASSMSRI